MTRAGTAAIAGREQFHPWRTRGHRGAYTGDDSDARQEIDERFDRRVGADPPELFAPLCVERFDQGSVGLGVAGRRRWPPTAGRQPLLHQIDVEL